MRKNYKKWHNYFAGVLKTILEPKGFKIETEVEVGRMPLKIDVVIIKKINFKKIKKLPDIFKSLNKYNIVEYKSPYDSLDIDSFDRLFAYALLYKIKNKITNRTLINTYAFTSGSINRIEKYIIENKHKLIKKSKGIYYSNFGFSFYLIKLDELPKITGNLEILLFGKRKNINKIIEETLIKKSVMFKEVLMISSELYPKVLKEVLKMPAVLKGNQKVIDEAIKIFTTSVGEDRIVKSIGEDKFVKSIGEDRIIKRLKERLGKQKLKQLIEKNI